MLEAHISLGHSSNQVHWSSTHTWHLWAFLTSTHRLSEPFSLMFRVTYPILGNVPNDFSSNPNSYFSERSVSWQMATVHQKPVHSNMLVSSVAAGTKKRTAESINQPAAEKVDSSERWKRPKWAQGYLWSENEISHTSSMMAMEMAPQLPCVPDSQLNSPIPNKMIRDHPKLFQIITPINIDKFEHLETHPNCPLINSVCQGLWEGFWPYTNIVPNSPDTFDFSEQQLTE